NVAFAVLHLHADALAGEAFVEATVSEIVRDSDVVGRYGSHKYEVLLPSTSPSEADEAMARIRTELAQRGLTWNITVTCCPRDGRSPYKLAARPAVETPREPVIESNEIIVVDPQMESLHRMLELVARSQISVLLLGETGVGKEVFARAVHERSTRAAGPFVEVNCAALTETLLESELFGHERGAFTNATATKVGLIEAADTGTVFLDEIGDMPLGTQAKLLRVLEDSQIRRVGAVKSRGVDVRFVAATNSDLEAKVETGEFRRDLYFRLNGVTLVIPPLRERLAELEPLARAFIRRTSSNARLSPPALALMRTYEWPGNVRELRNTMERAVLLSDGGDIYPEHLPSTKMGPRATKPAAIDPAQRGSADEQQRIIQALSRTRGNQTAAARLLGISRRTLVNRLNEYDEVHRPRKHKPKK
ncbi:MAG TPA: sigma 54-interacting transcriptional regulator, partial [Kofleriaceae bacterium]